MNFKAVLMNYLLHFASGREGGLRAISLSDHMVISRKFFSSSFPVIAGTSFWWLTSILALNQLCTNIYFVIGHWLHFILSRDIKWVCWQELPWNLLWELLGIQCTEWEQGAALLIYRGDNQVLQIGYEIAHVVHWTTNPAWVTVSRNASSIHQHLIGIS